MGMTEMRNAKTGTGTAEPMLTPGEVREAPTYLGEDLTVKVYSVANGAYTHVRVVRPDGSTHHAESHRFETDALRRFAELKKG